MIDLSAPFAASNVEASAQAWPKCWPCSQRLAKLPNWYKPPVMGRGPGAIWYPVESLEWVGRDKPKELHDRYRLVVAVECHGAKETAAFAIPDWYTDGKVWEMLSHAIFFKRIGSVEMRTTRNLSLTGR